MAQPLADAVGKVMGKPAAARSQPRPKSAAAAKKAAATRRQKKTAGRRPQANHRRR
jgi:hypothetical protein